MNGEERRDRLPKWAQREMARLERALDAATNAVGRLAPNEDTAVVTDPYGHFGGTVGVAPRGEYVRFLLDSHMWLDVRVRHDGTGLDLMAAEALHLQCQASNTLGIEVRS